MVRTPHGRASGPGSCWSVCVCYVCVLVIIYQGSSNTFQNGALRVSSLRRTNTRNRRRREALVAHARRILCSRSTSCAAEPSPDTCWPALSRIGMWNSTVGPSTRRNARKRLPKHNICPHSSRSHVPIPAGRTHPCECDPSSLRSMPLAMGSTSRL